MKIATGLNETGQAKFEDFLRQNVRENVSTSYYAWWEDLNFDDNGCHFELNGHYTNDQKPVTISFSTNELVFAEAEIE